MAGENEVRIVIVSGAGGTRGRAGNVTPVARDAGLGKPDGSGPSAASPAVLGDGGAESQVTPVPLSDTQRSTDAQNASERDVSRAALSPVVPMSDTTAARTAGRAVYADYLSQEMLSQAQRDAGKKITGTADTNWRKMRRAAGRVINRMPDPRDPVPYTKRSTISQMEKELSRMVQREMIGVLNPASVLGGVNEIELSIANFDAAQELRRKALAQRVGASAGRVRALLATDYAAKSMSQSAARGFNYSKGTLSKILENIGTVTGLKGGTRFATMTGQGVALGAILFGGGLIQKEATIQGEQARRERRAFVARMNRLHYADMARQSESITDIEVRAKAISYLSSAIQNISIATAAGFSFAGPKGAAVAAVATAAAYTIGAVATMSKAAMDPKVDEANKLIAAGRYEEARARIASAQGVYESMSGINRGIFNIVYNTFGMGSDRPMVNVIASAKDFQNAYAMQSMMQNPQKYLPPVSDVSARLGTGRFAEIAALNYGYSIAHSKDTMVKGLRDQIERQMATVASLQANAGY